MKLESKVIKPVNRIFSYDSPRWLRVIEFFIRVRLFNQTPYLIDRWTIVEDTIDESHYNL